MPFEDDPSPYDNVPSADISTVKFHNLFDANGEELAHLLKACERDGFFYLDLRGPESEKLWTDIREISQITQRWFSQPDEVKVKTPTVSLSHG